MIPTRLLAPFLLLAGLVLSACAPGPATGPGDPVEVAALAAEIEALGPGVDPEEAARAARISYAYTAELAARYQITDGPLVHNMKVNAGLKPRGLCWHWAEDMENRLNAEAFRTLTLHRAIANADSRILLDHSTAIVSRRGDDFMQGIVLDPWREGGRLHWVRTAQDERYDWVHEREVMLERNRKRLAREAAAAG